MLLSLNIVSGFTFTSSTVKSISRYSSSSSSSSINRYSSSSRHSSSSGTRSVQLEKSRYSKVRDSSSILFSSVVDNDSNDDPEPLTSPRRLAYFALWLSLVTYAFTISPGGSEAATAIDNQMIQTIIQTPNDGTVTPVFSALFNSLGILPAVYASLLLPGANKKQKIPGLLFVISSFALGFFGVGPYLALRRINIDVTDSNKGMGSGIFENKLTSIGSLLFGIYLVYFAFTAPFEGDRVAAYFDLFANQRLAHVSTIDFTILSIAMNEPMSEDMQRRGWEGPSAVTFCAIPLFGPIAYLLLRPSLPK